ncbi:acyltransferase [Cohnella panacarvi]|uniref:acyltransferase n=1 Tax=Cohnella panacarvi TaxID=400776 RepID=UPI00047D43A7|nr:acyltransferase [Cohnella panacarvi]
MAKGVWILHKGFRRIKNKFMTEFWYRHLFYRIGRKSSVSHPFYTENPELIQLGDKVYIGPYCRIEAYPPDGMSRRKKPTLTIGNRVTMEHAVHISCAESLVIEDDVMIAGRCYISDNNHSFDPLGPPYKKQPASSKHTRIGKGVWLGQNVCILAGADVGEGSVIGAGSIVNGYIPAYSIAVGTPARVIKRYNFDTQAWVKSDGKEINVLRQVQL